MNKKEVGKILETISTMYQNKFKVNDPVALLEIWNDALKDYEFDLVFDNLKNYFKNNHFPPSVADLVKVEKRDRAIPTREETLELFKEWDRKKDEVASKERVEAGLEEMRKILGIKRG